MASYDEIYAEASRRASSEKDVVKTALMLMETNWTPPLTPLQHVREALIEEYLERGPRLSQGLKDSVTDDYRRGKFDEWTSVKSGMIVLSYLKKKGMLRCSM